MEFRIDSYEEWLVGQDLAKLREDRRLESLYKKCPTEGLPLLGSVPFACEMGYGINGALDDDQAVLLAELLLASRGKYPALYLEVGDEVSLYGVTLDEDTDFGKYLRRCYARFADDEFDRLKRSLLGG